MNERVERDRNQEKQDPRISLFDFPIEANRKAMDLLDGIDTDLFRPKHFFYVKSLQFGERTPSPAQISYVNKYYKDFSDDPLYIIDWLYSLGSELEEALRNCSRPRRLKSKNKKSPQPVKNDDEEGKE